MGSDPRADKEVALFHFQPREYQGWATDAFFQYYSAGGIGHPVIAMPTGTGKSVVIAALCTTILTTWPTQRILMLAPTKELVEQNAEKLRAMWPAAPLGICSASLNKYDTANAILFGTIGTVINRKEDIGPRDLVFVDECHLVSDKESTQYRAYFDYLLELNPDTKFIGLSATPYRLGVGHIVDGGLFTDVCFDSTTLEAFNWFIEQGYLLPVVPRPTKTKLDTEGVKKQGGEFQAKDLQRKVNKAEVTTAAVAEALDLAADRSHCLWFSTGIEHAEAIGAELESHGESVVVIHSKSATRDADLAAFLAGEVRHCVNYGILTTGFDFPAMDCIIMLRPTKSPGLWVQMLGRGTRPFYAEGFDLSTTEGRLAAIAASTKQNCLVLDFAYNTAEMGPINDPKLPKKKGKGGGDAPIKTCGRTGDPPVTNLVLIDDEVQEGCGAWNHPSARHCIQCGAEFTFEVKFGADASTSALLVDSSGAYEKPVVNEFKVSRVSYEIHKKPGRPDSIRVFYYCGLRRFSHYVLPEHGGNPRKRSEHWWSLHGGGAMPESTLECRRVIDSLRVPAMIRVWEKKDYPQIMDWIFPE